MKTREIHQNQLDFRDFAVCRYKGECPEHEKSTFQEKQYISFFFRAMKNAFPGSFAVLRGR